MTRDEDVKTIREALNRIIALDGLGVIAATARSSFAALDRLTAEPPQDARELADKLFDYEGAEEWRKHAAALIVADREANRERVLREAAERYCKECNTVNSTPCNHLENRRRCRWSAAILGGKE